MGGALLAGWRAQGVSSERIYVVESDVARAVAIADAHGVTVATEPSAVDETNTADVIVLAVKPQQISLVLPAYAGLAARGALILSIAAGCTIGGLSRALGGDVDAAIVRAMPNTPAAIGRGMTVACAGLRVTTDQRRIASDVLAAVGQVAWVDDEALMDAVTAVSGSGPAYVFLLAECLAEAGVTAGLPATLAAQLARETVIGAAALLDADEAPPETLRTRVTSPGGTTAAALDVLMGPGGLKPVLNAAVDAAARRSRELSGGS